MRNASITQNLTILAIVAAMLLCVAAIRSDATASPNAGPWCVSTIKALQANGMNRADRVEILLNQRQKAPERNARTPRRVVFVSSSAPRGGTGLLKDPFRSIQDAVNRAAPGDEIRVLPGEYAPVSIKVSGTAAAPIALVGVEDETGRAVIDGTGKKARGLIAIRGASHITVRGFRLQNAPRDGVFVEGTARGERAIRIFDNDIHTTRNSGIYVGGIVMRNLTAVDEYRLFDVIVEGNRVTRTNEPRGVNEAITLGGGVDGFSIRNNQVFTTRQYGIDVKAGAINGNITDNVIYGVERHGIYLDAGSRRVANVLVTRNAVFDARNGIAMARESGRDPQHPNLHDIRVVDNLLFNVEKFGILAYRHPKDSGRNRFGDVVIERNCLCGVTRDAVRLGGIAKFADNFSVRDNLIMQSGGAVWNEISAVESGNEAPASLQASSRPATCPPATWR